MATMIFNWILEDDNEFNRYIFTATLIAYGYYGKNLYYVLPELKLAQGFESKVVYFPRINIPLSKEDWENLKNEDFATDHIKQRLSIKEKINITAELNKLSIIRTDKLKETKVNWEKKSKEFLITLSNIFVKEINLIDTVNIYPVSFGSPGSYNLIENSNDVNIYYRVDQDVSIIAELILTALVRKLQKETKDFATKDFYRVQEWLIIEHIVDFIFINTKLTNLFPKFNPTMKNISVNEKSSLYLNSKKYLQELGFSIGNSLYKEQNNIYRDTGEKLKGLTNQEMELLSYFVDNTGSSFTYEEIAKVMWKENYLDKFSLYAINKVIFQIRNKLKINGAHSVKIETIRNKGYAFYC